METYLSPIWIEPLPRLGLYKVFDSAIWQCEKGYRVTLPVDFVCDGASVPKWAWPLLDSRPAHLLVPGLFHNYLVRKDAHIYWEPGKERPLNPELAAEIMDDIMQWIGIPEGDREKIMTALKFAAFFYWHQLPVEWDPE